MELIPKIPLGDWVGVLIDLAQQHLGWLFAFIYLVCDSLISALQNLLLWPDPVIFIAVTMHRRLRSGPGTAGQLQFRDGRGPENRPSTTKSGLP